MDTLIYILGILFLGTSVILPWIQRQQIKSLKDELNIIQKIIDRLIASSTNGGTVNQQRSASSEHILSEEATLQVDKKTSKRTHTIRTPIPEKTVEQKPRHSFEEGRYAAKLPVWIGGIALALSGFYFVKYSIDHNLLNPTVRVVLGAVFGCVMLYVSYVIKKRPGIANGERISQSLSGAGIAILYVVSYAATHLYDLIPIGIGFVAMALVTVVAVILSVLYGPAIALLGMFGGFLTPMLMSTGAASAPALFTYLLVLFAGFMIIIRRNNWWLLGVLLFLGSMLWVSFWLAFMYQANDSLWLGLFLLGIVTIMVTSGRYVVSSDVPSNRWMSHPYLERILYFGGVSFAVILMGSVAMAAGFGLTEWMLFALLALGTIGLAYFNGELYGRVPLFASAVTAVMLLVWNGSDLAEQLTLITFVLIYTLPSYWLMWRSKKPVVWALLMSGTSLVYYLIAYDQASGGLTPAAVPFMWGMIALVAAIICAYLTEYVQNNMTPSVTTDYVRTIFAVASTAFVAIGLTIELPREFLSVAIAIEMAAIAWIYTRVSLENLRIICALLAIVFSVLLFPQIVLLYQLTLYSLVGVTHYVQSSVPIVDWPLFQLGIPAMMFAASSYYLRRRSDGRLVRVFEVATIALIAVMGYYVTRHAFHTDANILFKKANLLERGTITNILFIYALACLYVGRRFKRQVVSYSGVLLSAIALFRVVYFDGVMLNPFWSPQEIAGVTVFNTMLLPYALPIAWLWLTGEELKTLKRPEWLKFCYVPMFLLGFMWLSINVAYFFKGSELYKAIQSDAELYSYSVIWLLYGLALLFLGVLRKERTIRYASLLMLLITVGKVFVVDAMELEGLYRVFSFLGLGVSLIGLSWFYMRFVGDEGKERLAP